MLRIRPKIYYKQHKSLFNLAEMIFKPELLDMLQVVVTKDSETALIFSSDKLLKQLNNEKELFM